MTADTDSGPVDDTAGSPAGEAGGSESAETGARDWLIIYLKGLGMGSADAVPGVSGGTIALIVGVYERLIAALTALDPAVLSRLPTLHRASGRQAIREDLSRMDVPFLLALGGGMATAVILLARVVEFALETIPGPTFAFFFGLIGASAIVLADREWIQGPKQIAAAVVGFTVAFTIAGISGAGAVPSSLPVIFVAGSLAISGMLLPGISGAFILLLLGQYSTMTGTLNEFVDGLLALGRDGVTGALVQNSIVIAVFLSGAAVGVLTVAYAVRWALANHRQATLICLVSLMLGSLRLPVVEMIESSPGTPAAVGTLVAAAVAGGALVIGLDYTTEELAY